MSADLAEEFRQTLARQWTPLGQILIELRVLEMSQLMALLALQADEPHMREGYANEAQIPLETQRGRCPGPIEMIFADPRVDSGEFLGPLMNYVRFLEGRVHHLAHAS